MTEKEKQPNESVVPIATLIILTEVVAELSNKNSEFRDSILKRLQRSIDSDSFKDFPDSLNLVSAFMKDMGKSNVEK